MYLKWVSAACAALMLMTACQSDAPADLAREGEAVAEDEAASGPGLEPGRVSVSDGIYLVTDSEEGGIWLPVQGFDFDELVQRERLMPLEIASAVAKLDENYGAPVILVTLAESQREPFARLTAEHQRQKFALVVDSTIVVASHITGPIQSGRLQIGTPGGDLDAARAIANKLLQARSR